ncbi:histidine kinase M3YPp [Polychaeton citri CBS 116435]|uniref:Histidine kinase M3YPp n=1 Tax=Polychaeton citri CBS 116435 TaxID=1314669 RepID=A0A9P4US99_9PEZI|nr:histidine kinase M3YPp [Polychaeton citri CBS 116435]
MQDPSEAERDCAKSCGRATASHIGTQGYVSEHVQLLRDWDWASTELGPLADWTPNLRRMVNLLVADPRPSGLYWGKKRILLYNEAYIPIAGKRHPDAMLGLPFDQAWPEVVGTPFCNAFEHGKETGHATSQDSTLFFVTRSGYLEEMYASWSIIPIPAEGGHTAFYNPCFETTKQVVTERRMSTLLSLGQCLSLALDSQDFWKQCIKGLQHNLEEIPFLLMYAASQDNLVSQNPGGITNPTPSEASSTHASKQWALEGMVGLPPNCPSLPSRLDSQQANEAFYPGFSEALYDGTPVLLSIADGTFPQSLVPYAKSRGFGDQCTQALLCPVQPTSKCGNIQGFIIVGVNPRREYDTDYQQFVQLLHRQLATSLASIMLIEDEIRRSRIAADLATQDRIKLAEQLAESKQEAAEIEMRFRRMADHAPMPMFHFDEMGNVLYANEAWFELTQHPRGAFYPLSWYNVIHEDDHPLMDQEWAKLGRGEPVYFELRLKKPFVTGDFVGGEKVEGTTWIIAAAYTDNRKDGSVKYISGCLTDISRQKWAEGFQERRMQEAMELKRQQENFMDMTSHEARNPLSAITLCAESIASTLKTVLERPGDHLSASRDIFEAQLENADIIMTCAQHQKRIIDDVLTLSKLDSGMLLITFVEVQPAEAVAQALKMFSSELQKADVSLDYVVDPSYKELDVNWVKLDPSRVMQVLINFLTNAIKFTQNEETRNITVTLKASKEIPSVEQAGLDFFCDDPLVTPPPATSSAPFLFKSANSTIHLLISVKDTGRGLTEEEMQLLFQRFQQASPKTHVEYGGSGLGLFISRQLVRLQGGQIGVASVAGEGSTFAFYVKATRCPAPRTSRAGSLTNDAISTVQAHITTSGDPMIAITKKVYTPCHLLVVEDNLVNQRVMSKQLARAGYRVAVANHGAEALEYVRQSRFCKAGGGTRELDIILMDVEMPIMDGLTCARHIRDMEASGELVPQGGVTAIPVVAVTANARAEQQAAALEAGMNSVVTKPFKMSELIPELEKVRMEVSSES